MMAECRPVEAPEFALRSADDHAAGRVGEAVELTISPSASRNASSILSSVVVISARSRLGFFLRRAEVRSWRQAALRGRPAEGIKSPQSGGCGNQFVDSRWPYLDGLVSLDGHVVADPRPDEIDEAAWLMIPLLRAAEARWATTASPARAETRPPDPWPFLSVYGLGNTNENFLPPPP
jgi:hypothetical protein